MEISTIKKHSIVYYSYILLFIVLFFYGLYHGRSFLIPFSLASLFAMLLWPVSKFLEEKGLSRAWGAGICVFILLLFLAAFIFFFASQVAGFSSQMGNLQSQLTDMVNQFKDFLQSQFGLNTQNLFSGTGSSSGSGGGTGFASGAESSAAGSSSAGSSAADSTRAGSGTSSGSGGGLFNSGGGSGAEGSGGGSGSGGFGIGLSSYISTLFSSL